jgi:UDP-N-acetyl-2-amino-2-deoxyglucuronate dehydrogenase
LDSTKNKIKFAIVGCGHIGKRHATIIENHPQCILSAFCDTRNIDVKDFIQRDIPFFQDLDTLLASDVEIDVVIIASPNGLHENQAIRALEANKHVVIEKPMALTKAGCERIIFKALQKQKQVFCVMQNRYSPPSVWLKDLVSSGRLGKIFMVQINCYWNRDDRYYKPQTQNMEGRHPDSFGTEGVWHGKKDLDGGVLFTQFSHFIDLMYWCFGDITNIQARLSNFNHQHSTEFEDSGFVSFDFKDGGMGSLNYSTAVWDKNLESSITIIAENGSVKVGGQYMDKIEYCHVKDYDLPTELKDITVGQNHQYVIDNIVEVLQHQKAISVNALEGMKVVEIVERMYFV